MLQRPQWSTTFRSELVDSKSADEIVPRWEALCARAVEDNVYYSPRYARALLSTVDAASVVRFATVWHGSELVAFLPFIDPRFLPPFPRRVGRAWASAYTFSGTPLLDRSCTAEAACGLIDALAKACAGEWMMPSVNVAGEACRAIMGAFDSMAIPSAFAGSFQRASFTPACTFADHEQKYIPVKRRKGLARNRRRLEELGLVEHSVHLSGAGLAAAAEAFLDIEARGWKGASGTALVCDKRTRGFAELAFKGDESESICRADVLSLNGKPLAVSLSVVAGRTMFAVKGTYDEEYRSYSPGLLLELEIVRSFLQERWADRLDGATAGDHVLDSLWPDRVEVADLVFSLDSHAGRRWVAALCSCESMKRAAKARLREAFKR